jgi:hypothetical protein
LGKPGSGYINYLILHFIAVPPNKVSCEFWMFGKIALKCLVQEFKILFGIFIYYSIIYVNKYEPMFM